MIAVDTSSFVGFLNNDNGSDVATVQDIIQNCQLVFPPVVVSELLSNPKLPLHLERIIKQLPLLEMTEGYWERVGKLRALLLSKKLKARLADTLIAQSCLDHHTPLLTRDNDFRHFVKYTKLVLVSV